MGTPAALISSRVSEPLEDNAAVFQLLSLTPQDAVKLVPLVARAFTFCEDAAKVAGGYSPGRRRLFWLPQLTSEYESE